MSIKSIKKTQPRTKYPNTTVYEINENTLKKTGSNYLNLILKWWDFHSGI